MARGRATPCTHEAQLYEVCVRPMIAAYVGSSVQPAGTGTGGEATGAAATGAGGGGETEHPAHMMLSVVYSLHHGGHVVVWPKGSGDDGADDLRTAAFARVFAALAEQVAQHEWRSVAI